MKLKEMIKLLLKRGASATASVKPVPPLVYAIFAGDADMAERLLSHGADPHYIMPSKVVCWGKRWNFSSNFFPTVSS